MSTTTISQSNLSENEMTARDLWYTKFLDKAWGPSPQQKISSDLILFVNKTTMELFPVLGKDPKECVTFST